MALATLADLCVALGAGVLGVGVYCLCCDLMDETIAWCFGPEADQQGDSNGKQQ